MFAHFAQSSMAIDKCLGLIDKIRKQNQAVE